MPKAGETDQTEIDTQRDRDRERESERERFYEKE